MNIKRAKLSDLDEILTLQKIAYKSEADIYNNYSIPPLTQTLDEIKDEFKTSIFLKVVENGKIIGSVRAVLIKDTTCYIGRLIIDPDFQNQGIGTRLMDKIEKIFHECERYELITGHMSEKNIKLYEKLGYRIFKTEKLTKNLNLVYLEKINR
ncbi:MAG: GNAT family N-acetyltransferase [Methanobacterium sp.]|uniref:GNAT family N-acetyltransferase n=1 Tax=Methanobacterium sp. TaxID=2164 RepID=UPI003D650807|nr:GNAT family N-acetyltransferase [Methanobacterium sp.]